eukprot:191094-Pleurochrysis_carterae.AAC.1
MPCRRALRQRDGRHERIAADLGGADHVVAESVTPQLVEGFDCQRKRKDVAALVGWALKFFLRFSSQVCRISDHRQAIESAFVLVELAG